MGDACHCIRNTTQAGLMHSVAVANQPLPLTHPQVYGIGPAKLELYGAEILQIIAECVAR